VSAIFAKMDTDFNGVDPIIEGSKARRKHSRKPPPGEGRNNDKFYSGLGSERVRQDRNKTLLVRFLNSFPCSCNLAWPCFIHGVRNHKFERSGKGQVFQM
jgi:hypothetical protein